jgi:hypothetical protein
MATTAAIVITTDEIVEAMDETVKGIAAIV